MTTTTVTIEELKAQVLADTQAAQLRIAERKERLTLERTLKELNDDTLQEGKAVHGLLNDAATSLNVFMERASAAVKHAQFQTRTGSELKLNFFPTRRKHLVVNKLTGLMNSMVYTRDDVSQLVAEELGLTEVDVENYRNALGRGDSFTPDLGVVKGFKGNAVSYNNNLHMLAEKLGVYIPDADFSQEDFDTFYSNSVERALEEQEEARLAEQAWDTDNTQNFAIDLE